LESNQAEGRGDVSGKTDQPAKVPIRRLLALAVPEWRRLAAATIFLVIGGAAGLAWPQIVRVLIDAAVGPRPSTAPCW
jgi:hypothetical protein